MKRSIIVETIITTPSVAYSSADPRKTDVIEVTVDYCEGGTSYFTGNRHKRGYRLSATPMRVDGTSKSFMIGAKGGGIYHFIQEATRFNQRTLAKLADQIRVTPEYLNLIESCLAHNQCQRIEDVSTPQDTTSPPGAKPPITHYKMNHSPWGKVDGWSPFGDRGLYHHSTTGHGGIYVPPEMKELMPKPYQDANAYGRGCWFEEDCEWSLVALSFPSGLSEKEIEQATHTAKNWYPHAYMAVTGEKLTRKDSSLIAQEEDRAAAVGRYVVVAAWGSGDTGNERIAVPKGMVGCFAVLGGRDERGHYDESTGRYLLIPEEEYAKRSTIGFIIRKAYPAWPQKRMINPSAIEQARNLFVA